MLSLSRSSLLGFLGGGNNLIHLTRTGGYPPSLVSDEGGLNAVVRWILLALGGLGFLLLVSSARCSSESPVMGYGGLPPAWSVVGRDLAWFMECSGGWAVGESTCFPSVSAGVRSGALFDVWRWRVRRPGDDGGIIAGGGGGRRF
ncbi:hypothetical protein RchiOBHm_Chr1g0319531 [Rosa chinensis]|uniref:Uncharacterized protein n=1 Tax=Rosa chinensis TaxID=74649 RepID=A0A2P6S8E5_ROSCH|nr:hypothetical protein RchiOBHm_Chr1g0319531 [Rosa chinensis]